MRHYQIGFGHEMIKKKKHRKAASMTVFDEMQRFLKEQEGILKADGASESKMEDLSGGKTYGITVEDDSSALLQECGDLLQFMMQETAREKARQHGDEFNPLHHDYFKHKFGSKKWADTSEHPIGRLHSLYFIHSTGCSPSVFWPHSVWRCTLKNCWFFEIVKW